MSLVFLLLVSSSGANGLLPSFAATFAVGHNSGQHLIVTSFRIPENVEGEGTMRAVQKKCECIAACDVDRTCRAAALFGEASSLICLTMKKTLKSLGVKLQPIQEGLTYIKRNKGQRFSPSDDGFHYTVSEAAGCQEGGGRAAVIKSQATFQVVMDLIRSLQTPNKAEFLIGLKGNATHNATWIDGTPFQTTQFKLPIEASSMTTEVQFTLNGNGSIIISDQEPFNLEVICQNDHLGISSIY